MCTSKIKIQQEFKDATDSELLINIRVSKVLSLLFSRNFFRAFLFIFMMLINLYFFSKTGKEMQLLINTIAGVFLSFFITEYINTDENAAIEKNTVVTLRKMREELKEKQKFMSRLIIDYNQNKQPDFIGDIHGHFDALVQLFKNMGYTYTDGIYIHPERFPVFIGDYIDRGPKVFETIELVKRMQESGNAIALMGNHEFNYLELHIKDLNGSYFRSQSKRNQVKATDDALQGKDINIYLDWMATLPIAIESEYLRAVHAQWDKEAITILKKSSIEKLDENGLRTAHADTNLYKSIEVLLKGKEIQLPEMLHYEEHGMLRTEARIKWWQPRKQTFFGEDFASIPIHMIDKDITTLNCEYDFYYDNGQVPVFFGHYWMDAKKIQLMSTNACCVDYSIAKDGILVAYRYNFGEKLSSDNFITHNIF